ncbi:MAG: carboxypeptidase regulatory-like domain-containing protein [Armatimonadetes bacterium]|nr:carboxypeptidase regulatory-like domain-containing protein [Armatimonadota bacterium]
MSVSKLAITGALVSVVFAALCLSGCGGGGGDVATADVTGTIQDDSSLAGLSGAVARVDSRTSAPTGPNGFFTVENVPVGTRQLVIALSGYQTVTVPITVNRGGTNIGTVYVPPVPIPGQGHIVGELRDNAGTVAGGTIVAGGKTAVSKPNGQFAIYNVAPGATAVTAQFSAKIARANITVTADQTTSVVLGLSVSPPTPPAL